MAKSKKKPKKPLNAQQRQVRDQKIWNLRIEGYSQWDIAKKVGLSQSRIQQIIEAQYKEISTKNSETRETAVLMDLQRIDMLIQKSLREMARSEAGKKIIENTRTEKEVVLKHGGRDGFTEELHPTTEAKETIKEIPPEIDPALVKAINSLIDQKHKLLGTYEANKKVQEDDGPKDAQPKQYELKISLPDGTALGPIHNYNDIEAALNATTQQDPHRFEHEPDTDAS